MTALKRNYRYFHIFKRPRQNGPKRPKCFWVDLKNEFDVFNTKKKANAEFEENRAVKTIA